jgi:hypothetical protein
MLADRQRRALVFGALLVGALALAGCSTTIADMPGVGTPADAPPRPQEAGAYPPVNDLPPDRDQAVLDPAQRDKIEKELLAARDRQAQASVAPDQSANAAKAATGGKAAARGKSGTTTKPGTSSKSATTGQNASAQVSAAK